MYKCNTIDPRIGDLKVFNKTVKTFIYADLIEKPEELVLYKDIEEGGLGLMHVQNRAKAALISTFLQTAISPNFSRNFYHNYLYRYYILGENLPKPDIPQNFAKDFFPTIRKLRENSNDIENSNLKSVYNFLMTEILRSPTQAEDDIDAPLIPLKCKIETPETDWKRTWRLTRLKGLGPDLTSFMLKTLWRVIPTGYYQLSTRALPVSTAAPPRRTPETLDHALYTCEANQGLPDKLLSVLKRHQPDAVQRSILTLDLELEPPLELPFTWIIGTILFSIWSQREIRRVDLNKTRANLEARCRIMRNSKAKTWENASTLAEIIIGQIFEDLPP